jgi:hypothetical protein
LAERRDGLGPTVAQVIGGWEEIHVFGVFSVVDGVDDEGHGGQYR